ncbi:hypothetical protein Btru_069642 [Bulinus truncatus]|nr:hypothetical protein Btru_069642 [Bulinus truncatus]
MSRQVCHIKYATSSMSRQVCHIKYATSSMSHQVCHIMYVTSSMPHQVCHIKYATSSMPHQVCHIKYATSSMPHQVCHIKYATSSMSHQVYGGLTDGLDNYTFIISNDVSHAATNEIVLAVVIQGSFGSTFPPIMVNVFCVCNSTSSGLCQGVPYETTQRTNQNVTSSPPSSQPLTISSFYSSFLSAVSCKTKLTEVESSCYTGADYLVLTPVNHFVDCCSLCCNYQRCLGLNFHPAGKRCDLVLEPAAPTSLSPLAGCQFWNNTLST